MTYNGILNVCKPSGPTSYEVLAGIKRATGEKKIGHGGTLDPLASGVLPVFFNKATRLVEYLHQQSKTYVASIKLGVTTDSFDCFGQITSIDDASGVNIRDIESILSSYTGEIMQKPPVFSALKKDGKPLYELARQGASVEAEARRVIINYLRLIEFKTPLVTLEIDCSKGTYIRSLAQDIGQSLGVGAVLTGLVRTRYGPFRIGEAFELDRFLNVARDKSWASMLEPMETVLNKMPTVTLSEQQGKDAINGKQIELSKNIRNQNNEIYARTRDSEYMLLMKFDEASGLWQPRKVLKDHLLS